MMISPKDKCSPSPIFECALASRTALMNQARRIVGCPYLAEDIFHDALLKLHERSGDMPIRDMPSYLSRIVRNLSIDRLRNTTLSPVWTTEDSGVELACDGMDDPERSLQCRQALRIIFSALEDLPERTRRVFKMHRIDGIPQKDIARRLGVSPTLVNFMIRDAHVHCRSKLQDQEINMCHTLNLCPRKPSSNQ